MIKNGWQIRLLAGTIAIVALSCGRAKPEETPLQGTIELDERVIGFEIGGRVTEVEVRRGDPVKPNQKLASLDDELEKTARTARAAEADVAKSQVDLLKAGARPEEIRAAEADVRAIKSSEALIEKTLARERDLAKKGASTQAAVDELETRLATTVAQRQAAEQRVKSLRRGARSQEIEGAESRREAAETTLNLENERVERHSIRAPLEGTILEVHVDPGEVVTPGAPIVTLGDINHPYADVFVPIGQLDGIQVGVPASVRVDSVPAPFPAKVEHVSRRTEFTPRYLFSERERPSLVVRVRLRIEDPEHKLHAGVPAFAKIEANGSAPR